MDIRAATVRDLEAIGHLWEEKGALHSREFDRGPARQGFARRNQAAALTFARHLQEQLRSPERHILVAEEKGQVVGFLNAVEKRRPSLYEASRVLKVQDLHVQEGKRGQGVGSALLAAAEEIAKKQGIAFVTLAASVANDRGLKFYQDRGYHPHRVHLVKKLS